MTRRLCDVCSNIEIEKHKVKHDQCYECIHHKMSGIRTTLEMMIESNVINKIPTMEITISTITGKSTKYFVPVIAKIIDLKRIIEVNNGLPPHLFHLLYNGKTLPYNDTDKLTDYDIKDGSKLGLVSRLR
jgi:hypothetical protein